MKRRIKQILTVLGALAVTFGVLWAGQTLLRRMVVAQPLDHLLKTDHRVKSYHITHQSGPYDIKVTFYPGGDFRQKYLGVQREISDLVGPAGFTLEMAEPTLPALLRLEEQFDLAVQEGIVTGRFNSAMAPQLQALARAAGGHIQLSVDGSNVYLNYEKKGQSLEQVISRLAGGSAGGSAAGGSP